MNDSQLQHAVLDELQFEPNVNSAQVGVQVCDGVVTLTGHAASCAERQAAEKATKRLYGVKAVANEIDVRPTRVGKTKDEDLASGVVTALHWNALVPDDRVTVAVSDGWVRLGGTLDRLFQRVAAEKAVRRLAGVIGVTSDIQLNPQVTAEQVNEKIGEAFRRRAELVTRGVHVQANDGRVVLTGCVRSALERLQAGSAAWSTPGVNEVKNELVIAP